MKLNNERIQLIQPRHIYAPPIAKKKLGHIYMPTSLISIASVLNEAEVEIDIIDENINPNYDLGNVVGINLLGAPYIPVVKDFEARLKKKYGDDFILFIGGQIVNGLSTVDFKQLFGATTLNGNSYNTLFNFFNKYTPLKTENNLSFIPIYEKINDTDLKLYLENEISIYLSQGCKYSCTFCSAERTKRINGKKIFKKEIYRNIDLVTQDLKYLIEKAILFGLKELKIYLSNLDLFQTPNKLREFITEIESLKIPEGFRLDFRGLATVASFLSLCKNDIELLKRFKSVGLTRVGYGIDGATAEVYKITNKPQNSQMCLDAIRLTYELGITPETLMVFGHNNKENEESLRKAYEFSKDMYYKYGSYPRPHISKDIVPGNDGWTDPNNSKIIEAFYHDIKLFQNLDFTALPSEFTHPKKEFREMVSMYFIEICNLPSSLTQYVKPYNQSDSNDKKNEIQKFNESRYDI